MQEITLNEFLEKCKENKEYIYLDSYENLIIIFKDGIKVKQR